MDLTTLKHATDWFCVHSLHTIADPSGKIDRRELVVSLDQYPADFSLGPNPRDPDPRSGVAKDVKRCLREDGENFHLLNRGITVLAKGLEHDSNTGRVRLRLHETQEEETQYGILDGGNTNAQINEWRRELTDAVARPELQRRFVNVQVLIPKKTAVTAELEPLLCKIKQARNTSVQVKRKSLADASHHFEVLKEILAPQPYYSRISWKEGDKGAIDVQQILTLFMVFYPPFSEQAEPSGAYGRKEKCLDAYVEYWERCREDLVQWLRLVPDLLHLFDELQLKFPFLLGGRFGKIQEVKIYDQQRYEPGNNKKYRKTPNKTMFLGRDMRYEYPIGWLYPLFAGMRELVDCDKSSMQIGWKRDPFDFWRRHGEEVCSRYEPHLKSAGYESKKIATDPKVYSTIRMAVAALHPADRLAEAGIAA